MKTNIKLHLIAYSLLFTLWSCGQEMSNKAVMSPEEKASQIIESDLFNKLVDAQNAFNRLGSEGTLNGATPSSAEELRKAGQDESFGRELFKEKGHPSPREMAWSIRKYSVLREELVNEYAALADGFTEIHIHDIVDVVENELHERKKDVSAEEALKILNAIKLQKQ